MFFLSFSSSTKYIIVNFTYHKKVLTEIKTVSNLSIPILYQNNPVDYKLQGLQ